MFQDLKKIFIFFICSLVISSNLNAENANIKEVLEIIQKDLRTLERAVYSESFTKSSKNSNSQDISNQNAEDVLTKHLLKLSEIEKQFQELTNKYEEINFKLDKLSNRISKVQADNQMRFQDLERAGVSQNQEEGAKLTKTKKLPGSSEATDLGGVSESEVAAAEQIQKTQSVIPIKSTFP